MDVTALLEALDEYARDYITYVLSITSRTAFRRQRKIVEKRLVAFSLISVVLGVYLTHMFSGTQPVSQGATLSTMFSEYAVWLFMAVIAYFGLRRYGATSLADGKTEHAPAAPADPKAEHAPPAPRADRAPVSFDFQTALWIILRVLPVAYLVASYLAMLASAAGKFVMRDDCVPWAGLPTFIVAESIAIIAFLPVAIRGYTAGPAAARVWGVTLLITAALLVAQALSLFSYLRDNAAALYDKPENAQALAQAETFIDARNWNDIQATCPDGTSPATTSSSASSTAGAAASSTASTSSTNAASCQRTLVIQALEKVNWEGIEACFVR
jgi:hypothetical protein